MKISRNARVRAADGELGRVQHVIVASDTREVTDLVVVGDGREHVIPLSAVQSVDDDYVALRGSLAEHVSSAAAFQRDQYHAVADDDLQDQTTRGVAHGGAPLLEADDHAVVVGTPRGSGEAAPTQVAIAAADTDPYRLQLKAEQLRVGKQREQAGTVRLSKRVIEHVETVHVPLREERLVIECLPGNGTVMVGDRELQEGEVLELTLMKERISVDKQAVVSENISIRKELVERTEHVSETLREEQLTVADPSGLATEQQGSDDVAGFTAAPARMMAAATTSAAESAGLPTPQPARYAAAVPGQEPPAMMEGAQEAEAGSLARQDRPTT